MTGILVQHDDFAKKQNNLVMEKIVESLTLGRPPSVRTPPPSPPAGVAVGAAPAPVAENGEKS